MKANSGLVKFGLAVAGVSLLPGLGIDHGLVAALAVVAYDRVQEYGQPGLLAGILDEFDEWLDSGWPELRVQVELIFLTITTWFGLVEEAGLGEVDEVVLPSLSSRSKVSYASMLVGAGSDISTRDLEEELPE